VTAHFATKRTTIKGYVDPKRHSIPTRLRCDTPVHRDKGLESVISRRVTHSFNFVLRLVSPKGQVSSHCNCVHDIDALGQHEILIIHQPWALASPLFTDSFIFLKHFSLRLSHMDASSLQLPPMTSPTKPRGVVIFSGGSAANNLVDVFKEVTEEKKRPLSYVIPISDNGGSSSELIRVFAGPGGYYYVYPTHRAKQLTKPAGIGDIRSKTCKEEAIMEFLSSHCYSRSTRPSHPREWRRRGKSCNLSILQSPTAQGF
jgi:hypothetical protein